MRIATRLCIISLSLTSHTGLPGVEDFEILGNTLIVSSDDRSWTKFHSQYTQAELMENATSGSIAMLDLSLVACSDANKVQTCFAMPGMCLRACARAFVCVCVGVSSFI